MPYATAFDDWDPWDKQELPQTLPSILERERTRACKLLAGRDQNDLKNAAPTIHQMCIRGFVAGLGRDVELLKADERQRGYTSDFSKVRYAVEHFDLADFPLFRDARPADYFAVLTLAAIGELVTLHRNAEKRVSTTSPKRWTYSDITMELTNTASEAIAYAERLIVEPEGAAETADRLQKVIDEAHKASLQPRKIIRERVSQAGRKGGKKRASKFEPLKRECEGRAKEYNLSKRSALSVAGDIYDSLEDHWREIFDSNDEIGRIRTIASWLRKIKPD